MSVRTLVTPLAALLVFGLGCTQNAEPIEAPPKITSFTSSAATVSAGATVVLAWTTEHAASVQLTEAGTGESRELADVNGSAGVAVVRDSLFVLTAKNARGATEQAVVAVRLPSSAHDLLLYALPSQISAGDAASLTWSAPDAQAVTLTAAPGGNVELQGQLTAGTLSVSPPVTTTYTLTADGRTTSTTVTVAPKILSFIGPASVSPGDSATLSWTTAGANDLLLTVGGAGTLLQTSDASQIAEGSKGDAFAADVDPGTLRSYTLTVTDSAGASASKTIVVSVRGPLKITRFDAPTTARVGQSFTLGWSTEQADHVRITKSGAQVYDAPTQAWVADGSVQLASPSATTSYVLTASNARGESESRTVVVEPVGPPTITSFTATPSSVNAGTPTHLRWTATNARVATITEAHDGPISSATGNEDLGDVPVLPNHDATYKLVVDNGTGETAAAFVQVTVTNPIIVTANPSGPVVAGTPITLTWSAPMGSGALTGMPHAVVEQKSGSTGFEDIHLTGTKLQLSGPDDGAATIHAPNFHTVLFDRTLPGEVQVSTNGYLVFGPWVNAQNHFPVDLPTAKLEPFSLAPFWADLKLGTGGIYWQLAGTAADPTLIVQWNEVSFGVYSPLTFEVKVHQSGKVEFEYLNVPAGIGSGVKVGIQGPDPRWAITQETGPYSKLRLAYFGPQTDTTTVKPYLSGELFGYLDVNGLPMRLSYPVIALGEFDLSVSELMASPHPSVGQSGQWLELSNYTEYPLELSNWQVGLPDAGALRLSGTLSAGGQLVMGNTANPALNGDAGVTLATPNFVLAGGPETLSVGTTAATLNSQSFGAPDAGTAWMTDVGPFRWTTDLPWNSVPRPAVCAATSAYSLSPLQLGTPGTLKGCGFGYAVRQISDGFFDISKSGTLLFTGTDFHDQLVSIDLTAAPFPLFGTSNTFLWVSTHGWVSSDPNSLIATHNDINNEIPFSSPPNSMLAVFASDLDALDLQKTSLKWQRLSANQDPFAAAPHWIIQWSHFTRYLAQDDLTFQVKLFDDGSFEYHFGEMRSSTPEVYGAGANATTWLENPTGSQALVVSSHHFKPGIGWHTAFRFSPR